MSTTALIVDDSAVQRLSIRSTLEAGGYKVEEACDGRQALEVLDRLVAASSRPALILTDINMPVMDGLELLQRLKSSEHRFIPVLILTTESDREMKNRGRKGGAAGWIVKPFQAETLLAVVAKFVRPDVEVGNG